MSASYVFVYHVYVNVPESLAQRYQTRTGAPRPPDDDSRMSLLFQLSLVRA